MENNTQLLVNQVLHLYIQRSMHLLRDLKIHPGQCGMLWGLSQNDGLSQKELASKMGITPPSITVMIRKMEAEDLIEKHQLEKEAFANMSEQEIMLLHRLLLQMKENLIKGEKD